MADFDWARYNLKENPIPGRHPKVDVKDSDDRKNGRLLYDPPVKHTLEDLKLFVEQDQSPIFLNSSFVLPGTGKSALMAAEYWRLVASNASCFWVEVTGAPPMKRILLKVAYEMVAAKAIEKIKKKLEVRGGIREGIYTAPSVRWYEKPLTNWMINALSSPDDEFPLALADVTRKTRAFSVTDAFTFLLELYRNLISDRVFIFLDQLEIYVHYTSARQIALEMTELQRGVSDKAQMLATMHTDALTKLQLECGPDIQTFLEHAPVIQIPQYKAQDMVGVGTFLLERFRKKPERNQYAPFTSESLEFLAKKSAPNIRRFLVRMRSALMLGASSGYTPIDRKFLNTPAAQSHVFIELPIAEG
jgi:hypothetical protein